MLAIIQEIRKRTKITRSLCKKRNGGAALGAKNVGDLVTADPKVLSEGGDCRNNHRYAAGKTNSEPSEKPKVIFASILWNLATTVKNNHEIIVHHSSIDNREA